MRHGNQLGCHVSAVLVSSRLPNLSAFTVRPPIPLGGLFFGLVALRGLLSYLGRRKVGGDMEHLHELRCLLFGASVTYIVCWRSSRRARNEHEVALARLEARLLQNQQFATKAVRDAENRLRMAQKLLDRQEAATNFDCATCGLRKPWRSLVRPSSRIVCEDCVDANRCHCGEFYDCEHRPDLSP